MGTINIEYFAKAVRPYRRRLLLLLAASGGYLWFYILERMITVPKYLMFSELDNAIAFIPEFVIFYIAWYFYLMIPGALLFINDENEFMRYGAFLTGALYIACFVYTFWPNGIELRPDIAGAQGPFNALVRMLYSIDTPTNSAPSLHAAQSIAAHIAIIRLAENKKYKRLTAILSLLICVLILLSTVYIKQHSIIDMLWGLLLAGALGVAVYGRIGSRFLISKKGVI